TISFGRSQRYYLSRKRVSSERLGEGGELRSDHARAGRHCRLRRASRALRLPDRRARAAGDPLHVPRQGRKCTGAGRSHARESARRAPVGGALPAVPSRALVPNVIIDGAPRDDAISIPRSCSKTGKCPTDCADIQTAVAFVTEADQANNLADG